MEGIAWLNVGIRRLFNPVNGADLPTWLEEVMFGFRLDPGELEKSQDPVDERNIKGRMV